MGRAKQGTLGERAERAAAEYLQRHGLDHVCRNFRCRVGELDLVMLDQGCLVFVEVRCRRSSAFSEPAQTVDHRKQEKLVRTAALFTARNPRYCRHPMRFDVVAIEGERCSRIRWIRDAFRPDDSTL